MTGFTVTPAALHAALVTMRTLGAERDNDMDAAAFFIGALNVLEALFDPKRQPPRPTAGAAGMWPPATQHDAGPAPTLAQEKSQPAHADSIAAADPPIAIPPIPAAHTLAPPALRGIARAPGGGGAPRSVWTPERDALLRADLPTCCDKAALLARLRALPGTPIASEKAMMMRAQALGLRRSRETLDAIAQDSGRRGGAATEARHPTRPSGTRTAERLDLLRRMWPDPTHSVRRIFDAWNALPGTPLGASQSLYLIAEHLGMPRARPLPVATGTSAEDAPQEPIAAGMAAPLPAASAPPAEHPAPAIPAPAPASPEHASTARAWAGAVRKGATLPAVPDAKTEVFEAFDGGMTVRDAAAEFGLPLSTLSNWQAEWRLQQKQEPAA